MPLTLEQVVAITNEDIITTTVDILGRIKVHQAGTEEYTEAVEELLQLTPILAMKLVLTGEPSLKNHPGFSAFMQLSLPEE